MLPLQTWGSEVFIPHPVPPTPPGLNEGCAFCREAVV